MDANIMLLLVGSWLVIFSLVAKSKGFFGAVFVKAFPLLSGLHLLLCYGRIIGIVNL